MKRPPSQELIVVIFSWAGKRGIWDWTVISATLGQCLAKELGDTNILEGFKGLLTA